ncbi:hypothetical protein SG34_032775 [Thalassomonas viridans]|uniref:Uncharacterized protein n=1 Tax=Thalassomonas viridans TaxID=137584 RepID=A0AAE9ZDW9_9GAMM|nr:hypothetical protein [Thalassomonas viridans]WDE08687.1 hypothetical protein SG34_032775 [Thalassomonas viridans]
MSTDSLTGSTNIANKSNVHGNDSHNAHSCKLCNSNTNTNFSVPAQDTSLMTNPINYVGCNSCKQVHLNKEQVENSENNSTLIVAGVRIDLQGWSNNEQQSYTSLKERILNTDWNQDEAATIAQLIKDKNKGAVELWKDVQNKEDASEVHYWNFLLTKAALLYLENNDISEQDMTVKNADIARQIEEGNKNPVVIVMNSTNQATPSKK